MANLLYLVHRLPYPPNKGDKVRSFNLLKHLAKRHRVHLGTFIDDPDDEARLPLLRSCGGLLTGEALSLPRYRDATLREWAARACTDRRTDHAAVFSSVMAAYVPDLTCPKTRDVIIALDLAARASTPPLVAGRYLCSVAGTANACRSRNASVQSGQNTPFPSRKRRPAFSVAPKPRGAARDNVSSATIVQKRFWPASMTSLSLA